MTDSNTSLGLKCTRQFLSYKMSRLILAVRTVSKGEDAAAKLQRQHHRANIEVWLLDMSSYESIRAIAKRTNELLQLDIASLNAGITGSKFKIVPNAGHEELLQDSHPAVAFFW